MNHIIWAPFLHIYQPPQWDRRIIRRVAHESYRPLMQTLKRRPRVKITLNINGSLTEQLIEEGLSDVVRDITYLARRGQIEFTGSAKYHPILPLIPPQEVERQIRLNQQTNAKYFGALYRPRGFYSPEMCYSEAMARHLVKLGFHWLIIDEIARNGKLGQTTFDTRYRFDSSPLTIVFRNRRISNLFHTDEISTPEGFRRVVTEDGRSKNYLITGFDGEDLGHHDPTKDKLFRAILDHPWIQTIMMTELTNRYRKTNSIKPLPCSWATEEENITSGIPYILWDNPKNPIHRLQWQLLRMIIKVVDQHPDDPHYPQARLLLDQALASDQFWWASALPWWEIKIIRRGAHKLVKILESLATVSPGTKTRAKKIERGIMKLARHYQTTGLAKKIRDKYLNNLRQEAIKMLFGGRVVK